MSIKIIASIIILMSLLALASAQEIAIGIATQEDVKEAGITPDNQIGWWIDNAFERITELFSENSKLSHAKERLAEVKVMIEKNKLEQAEKARLKFEEIRIKMKNQTLVEEHKILMDNLGQKISEIVAIPKGSMTLEQRQELFQEVKTLIEEHKSNIIIETEKISNIINQKYIQQACNAVVIRDNIILPACLGKWVLEENQCKWECGDFAA